MNNITNQREVLRLLRYMKPEQKEIFEGLMKDLKELEKEAKEKNITAKQFRKALFIVDMNNGFVNFGAMANPKHDRYNDLVPKQQELIDKFLREEQLINFILEGHTEDAVEFLLYPSHCILGTEEAEVIPEFKEVQKEVPTYYKNSINGCLNLDLQIDIEELKDLKEIVICGVCTDLCVMDFARTLARYMEEINNKVHIFVLKNCISTYNLPGHNKKEETKIAFHVMQAAGIEILENLNELEKREKELGLQEGIAQKTLEFRKEGK